MLLSKNFKVSPLFLYSVLLFPFTEVSLVADAFPNVMPPTDNNYPVSKTDTTKGIVVGWTQEKVTEELNNPIYWVSEMGLSNAMYYSKDK